MVKNTKKADAFALEKDVAELKKDYENVIISQKERIVKLREDNAEMAEKLTSYEKYQEEIAAALVDARYKANEIINDAKKRADAIIRSAEEQKNSNDRTMLYYKSSLKELEKKSERILVSIQSELAREHTPSLSIVNQ